MTSSAWWVAPAVASVTVAAAAVSGDQAAGGEVVPEGAWRSPGHRRMVQVARERGMVGAGLSGSAASLLELLNDVRDSRPRSQWNQNYPALDAGDAADLIDAVIRVVSEVGMSPRATAWERGVLACTTAYRDAGPLSSGMIQAALDQAAKAEVLRLGPTDRIPDGLTPLGRALAVAVQARGELARVPDTGSRYYLDTIWSRAVRLAIAADDAGVPLGGSSWDSGPLGSILVGVESATQRLGGVVNYVGRGVAAVAGEAVWGLLASPVGAVAALGALWLWAARGRQ